MALAARDGARAFLGPRLQEAAHSLELNFRHQRPHLGRGVESGPEADLPGRIADTLEHLIVALLLHEQARSGAATLAMVEEDGTRDARDRQVQIRIFEHDVGRLAAELQRDFLEVVGGCLDDQLAHFRRPGEGHLVDARMRSQRCAACFPKAGDHIEHARRQTRLQAQLGEAQRRQRRLFRGLQYDGTSCREHWPELPGRHQQREVPRDDLRDDADRLPARIRVILRVRRVWHRERNRVALDFRRPAGHVVEQIRRQRHIGGACHTDGLAIIERLELRELLEVLQDQIADPPENSAALRRRQARPGTLVERLAGRRHGQIDVGLLAIGDMGDHLFGGGIEDLEGATGTGVLPTAADQCLMRPTHEALDRRAQRYALGTCAHCDSPLFGGRATRSREAHARTLPQSAFFTVKSIGCPMNSVCSLSSLPASKPGRLRAAVPTRVLESSWLPPV